MVRTLTLLTLTAACFPTTLDAAPGGCPNGMSEMVVSIIPDDYPTEISWEVRHQGALIGSGNVNGGSLCLPAEACVIFTIMDSYGDGMNPPGTYTVTINGEIMAQGGGDYGYSESTPMNCPPGFTCSDPIDVLSGENLAANADTWYSFTAPQSGSYTISTCDMTECDTRIWVYDHCTGLVFNDGPTGSMYYADGGCPTGTQAQLNANLAEGTSVWVRVGSVEGPCEGSATPWTVDYAGPITGCTDPNSCNFDPLATVSDGSCLPWGDPACPQAPDLTVDGGALESSLSLTSTTVTQTNCYIAEGCLTGFGTRELVAFDTRIANIGELDYYIGNPSQNPDQFETQNCHGHTHYKGYAEYLLYDDQGQELAIGFKNGFCVMDVDCSGGGNYQYGCSDMGISAGCADIYGNGTSCNWLDITGVAEGLYTLVVRTNWDNDPDALGRMESNHFNNWGQVCIFIDRSPVLQVIVQEDCEPYVDCLGEIYGSAQMDCMGNCAGLALIGDLNTDAVQNTLDVNEYVTGILGNDLTPVPCNDIDQDGNLTVTDAALMAYCNYWNTYNHPPDSNAVHDHCNFPFVEIINPYDSVTFTIGALDVAAGWMDIHVKNPNRRMLGYELMLTGVQITDVESLYDPVAYPVVPSYAFGTGHLMCLSPVDSLIDRGPEFKPLCRVHFTAPEETICIDEVIDVVNENYHNSLNFLVNNCSVITGVGTLARDQGIRVFPNPFTQNTTVLYPPVDGTSVTLTVFDLQGRTVQRHVDASGKGRFVVEGNGLATGAYHYQLTGGISGAGKLYVEH
jgi:hypothetical protein